MAYKVSLTQPAEADAYAAYEYIYELAPLSAEPWLIGLFQAIETLSDFPARCPIIPETKELAYEARQLLYGKRSGTYRIIFDIQEDSEEGPLVRVLRIRHGARDAIVAADLGNQEIENHGN